MTTLDIIKEIANEPSTNKKMDILKKYKENRLFLDALYLADSPRIKFYVKQIPEYTPNSNPTLSLEGALILLEDIYKRVVTGHDAIQKLKDILESVSSDDAIVVERIIGKDFKMGMGKNINKIIPGLIEETPYMGATPYKKDKVEELINKSKVVSQIKMDGRYANCHTSEDFVLLESIQGEITYLPGDCKLVKELLAFKPGFVLNGELTIDGISRYISNGIIASIVSITKKLEAGENVMKEYKQFEEKHGSFEEMINKVVYTVWDVITAEEYLAKHSKTPYHQRLKNISEMIEESNSDMIRIIESKEVATLAEALSHFSEKLANGDEGTIIKDLNGEWKDGKPAYQKKVKLEIDLDLKITGFHPGTPGTKYEHMISSIEVQSEDSKIVTNPAGINEATMEFITNNKDSLLGKIVKVECSGLSINSIGKYSLLHPRFLEIRDDKVVANTLEEAIEIENGAKGI